MFQVVTVQSLIEERVNFRRISSGWMTGKCQLCHDYKERAGFKFENGHVIYNCWNCSTTSVYEENSGKISKTFRRILRAYEFEDAEISHAVSIPFFNKKEEAATITLEKLTAVNTTTPVVKLPANALPLGHNDHCEYQQKLVNYLVERCVDLEKYHFFFSVDERFKNRVIIPFYRNGAIVYWQARSIDSLEKKRYDNAPVSRDAVIFNFDKLATFGPGPLFVTEGVFDAMMVGGISILGSKLNAAKIELLSRSQRRLVFVIDKDSNGKALGMEALSLGYDIAFAPDGADDLNTSVQRFGLSWTIYELMKSIPNSIDEAKLAINMKCRGNI